MRMTMTFFGLVAVSALVACVEIAPVEPAPEPVDACGAEGYRGLIGQPRTILDGMTFPLGARVIGPDMAVTADFRADRLNIEYGRTGLIERVSCY